jgi:hypothetical protein
MKFATTLISLLLGSFVASSSLPFFGSTQVAIGTDVQVPGENPLTYCRDSQDGDLLTIERVDLKPNPPERYELQMLDLSAGS